MSLSMIRRRAAMTSMAAVVATGIGSAVVTMSLAPTSASAAAVEARIGQPTLYTNDIDAMSRFYSALGFTEEFRFPATDTEFATLRKGSFYVALVTVAAVRESTGINRIARGFTFQSDVTIFTGDVDGLYTAALAAGGRS